MKEFRDDMATLIQAYPSEGAISKQDESYDDLVLSGQAYPPEELLSGQELIDAIDQSMRNIERISGNTITTKPEDTLEQRISEKSAEMIEDSISQIYQAFNILSDNPFRVTEKEVRTIRDLMSYVHKCNYRWWHDEHGRKLDRNKGEVLCLIHSEISEAMEGERKSLMDDKLPHYPMAAVEMADAVIRIFDYCEGFGYDLAGAIRDKLEYNKTREDHSYEARSEKNGKKW